MISHLKISYLWIFAFTCLLSACASGPNKELNNSSSVVINPDPTKQIDRLTAGRPHKRTNNTPTGGSVWTSLRQEFSLSLPESRYLDQHLNTYLRSTWALESMLERSAPYLPWIVQEAKRAGVPGEIALLPAVESGFDPFAESPGDASGLWQFIPATGRRFGLHEDWWYNGRKDVVESTRAALEYLKYLNKRFDGDWLMALAAYNTGEGKIRAAIKNNRQAGKPADFWHLKLPKETRDYVPRLLALRMLVETPGKYGLTLPKIQESSGLAVTDVGTQIDLSVVAQLAEVPIDTLKQLNPAYRRWATPPQGPHQFVLPSSNIFRLQNRLAELSIEHRVRWQKHRIRSGETLGHIALHYQTTVQVLRQANGLTGDRIRAGKDLVIPTTQQPLELHTQTTAAHKVKWHKNSDTPTEKIVYGVRSGDTLSELAELYGVSVKQLTRWNNISANDYLKPGQELIIWVRSSSNQREA